MFTSLQHFVEIQLKHNLNMMVIGGMIALFVRSNVIVSMQQPLQLRPTERYVSYRGSELLSGLVYLTSKTKLTCSAILGLLDRDDDLRASHKLLNTERIL